MRTSILFGLCLFLSSGVYAQQRPEIYEERENPLLRFEWDELRLRDPQSGVIPADVRTHEMDFVQRLPVYPPTGVSSSKSNHLQTSYFQPFASIGPNNVGGRTRAFAIDYSNPNVFLAGGVTGGVWRSIDAGKTWVRVSPATDIHNVSSIAQSLVNPNIWYMGTGEVLSTTERRTSTNIRTIGTGTGIYRSTDGGVTWSLITPPIVEQQHNSLLVPAQGVWKLLCISPAAGVDAVYAALYGNVYVYLNNTWNPVIVNSNKPFSSDVVATPDAKSAYFALSSAEDGSKPEYYGIYRKEGSSYINITPPNFPTQTRRIKLAMAPSNKRIIYALTEAPPNWDIRYKDFSSINTLWKYTADATGNGGRWEQLLNNRWNEIEYTSLSGYALTLAVHPLYDSVVFMGGTNLYRTHKGFAESTEVELIGGYPYIPDTDRLHPDIHSLVFDPNNPDRLYVTCDGGIFYTDTCRSYSYPFWHSLNHGYHTTQCYAVALDTQVPNDNFVMTGLQDNNSYYTTTSEPLQDWTRAGGGDGTACQVMSNKKVIFGSWQFSNTYAFSLDQFQQPIYSNFESPSYSGIPQFVTSLLLDPAKQKMLYLAVGKSIYYYENASQALDTTIIHKDHWKKIAVVDSVLENKPGAVISCLAGVSSIEDAEGIFAFGTSNGEVYVVADINTRTPIIVRLTNSIFPKNAFVSSIDIDPWDIDKIVVSFSNYNVESIFYTSNGGTSWRSIAGNLENNPDGSGWGPSVRVVKIMPRGNAITFLAGTSTGLYSMNSDDNFLTWTQEGVTTIGNLTVEALAYRVNDGKVVVGTQGGGVYVGNFSTTPTDMKEEITTSFQLEQNYPNPVSASATSTRIYFSIPSDGSVQLDLYDVNGKLLRSLLDEKLPAGRHSYELTAQTLATLANGVYYYRLRCADNTSTKMLTLVR